MAAGFNLQHALDEPECLARFPEGGGAVFRYAGTVLGDLLQLAFTGRVALLLCQTGRFFRIAVSETDRCVVADQHCVIELLFFDVARLAAV